MIRLMTPPLPAAFAALDDNHETLRLVANPLLELDQLLLQSQQFSHKRLLSLAVHDPVGYIGDRLPQGRQVRKVRYCPAT